MNEGIHKQLLMFVVSEQTLGRFDLNDLFFCNCSGNGRISVSLLKINRIGSNFTHY